MPISFSTKHWRAIALVGGVALTGLSSSALAATLDITPDGQLLGASGVEIDGSFFDVAFVDGTCVEVFSGCDEASDFVSLSGSPAAALLEQVFLDGPLGQFDSNPELTNGITDQTSASILIVTNAPAPGSDTVFNFTFALNNADDETDFTALGSILPIAWDTTFVADTTFARFTPSMPPTSPVPLPAAAWFLIAGLGALSALRLGNEANGVSNA